jgi:hypothetical protein
MYRQSRTQNLDPLSTSSQQSSTSPRQEVIRSVSQMLVRRSSKSGGSTRSTRTEAELTEDVIELVGDILQNFETNQNNIQQHQTEMSDAKKVICHCQDDKTRETHLHQYRIAERNFQEAIKSKNDILKCARDTINYIERKDIQNVEWEIETLTKLLDDHGFP